MISKRLFLFLNLMIVMHALAYAEDISEQQALQIATQTFTSLNQKQADYGKRRVRNIEVIKPVLAHTQLSEKGNKNLYVFNNEGNESGFVILAANDNVTDIVVGYSEQGYFSYDTAPCALKMLLKQFAGQIDIIRDNPSCVAHRKAPRKALNMGNVVVQPLIKTRWNQCQPFNDMCPIFEANEHTFNGCIPTAVAQIMNYWKWPKQGRGANEYFWYPPSEENKFIPDWNNKREMAADFSMSIYDWDNMLNDYSFGYNKTQADAVAKIMIDVGVGVEAVFGYNADLGTMASSEKVPPALVNFFDYNSDSISIFSRVIYTPSGTDDGLDELIRRELDMKRPVLLTGQPAKTVLGHAMVLDGYTDQDFFHINFGWGGECDGYYQTTLIDVKAIKPEYRTQHDWIEQQAILGICPNYSNKINDSYYRIDGEKAILTFTDAQGVVDIPQTVTIEGKNYDVTDVSKGVFKDREGITEIKLPNTIRKVGDSTFEGCKDLTSVTLSDNLEIIPDNCFRGCTNLSYISQPSKLKEIGTYAFAETKIQGFQIPQNMTTIPEGIFYGCEQLMSITINNGIEEIQNMAFYGCKSLKQCNIPSSVKNIEEAAFELSGIEYVTLNDNIDIGKRAFANSTLASIFPGIYIKNIDEAAFLGTKLLSISLDNVEAIENQALAGCTLLKDVTIGPSLKKFGSEVFLACNSLTEVTIDENNNLLKYIDGVFYSADQSRLIYCTPQVYHQYGYGPRNEFSVPENVTTIEPQGLTALRDYFYSITFPASLHEIGEGALSNARNLKNVYNYATTPQPIESVNVLTGTGGVFNPLVFDRPDWDKCTLHVLPGCKDAYLAAQGWNQFELIVEDLTIDGEAKIYEDNDPLQVRNGVMLRFLIDMFEFEDYS